MLQGRVEDGHSPGRARPHGVGHAVSATRSVRPPFHHPHDTGHDEHEHEHDEHPEYRKHPEYPEYRKHPEYFEHRKHPEYFEHLSTTTRSVRKDSHGREP
ncbi:hypothetical protein GCM10018785_14740 [Streptomyces longispororuber]|uniref:Uncharacterized protein n=1 Tax=Streptomyces longispororuber TaxID=68230 RepID=A0A919DHY9_9ACTN|nr:hypothetical protein [Streptomyces longispororuber]GHE46076.1 hypothetical protein GCM10018785_14740 [Streptomyces longispororuber]